MAVENRGYENIVIENKIEDILETRLDMSAYATPDYSLTEKPGMKKLVNKYVASGAVEDLGIGEGNTESIDASFTGVDYEVGVTQGRFPYYDEEEMRDPVIVETGLKGLAATMVNDLTTKIIDELDKATTVKYDCTWSFDDIVDAIAMIPNAQTLEDESGLFLLISPQIKAAFRKALGDDLKYSEGFARTGYIGHICGVPVIVSNAVPYTAADAEQDVDAVEVAYLATKEAVTIFVKKGTEIEQERDANTRKNTIYARKVALVALTDDTKVVKLTSESEQ